MIATNEPKNESFLGETLFHFLGTGDDERLLDVFDSIVRRGLLLTIGNKQGKLDRFPVQMADGGCEFLEVMQHAGVCFTDIPEKLLSTHCQEYWELAWLLSQNNPRMGRKSSYLCPKPPGPRHVRKFHARRAVLLTSCAAVDGQAQRLSCHFERRDAGQRKSHGW